MPPVLPERVREFAAQTIDYVRAALGVTLDYTSETLPVLDHYLRGVPADQPAALRLVLTTSAAYFGEVVRQRLGGRWDGDGDDPLTWRMILPSGVSLCPAGMVGAAVVHNDVDDLDTRLEAPPRIQRYVDEALARMSPVTEGEFYSLCGRLDTLEHVHEVVVTVAAQLAGDPVPAADDGGDEPGDDPAESTADPDVN